MSRWFAAAEVHSLRVAERDFTSLERETAAALSQFMLSNQGSRCELMHCLDARGHQLIDTSTGVGEALVTEAMKEAMRSGQEIRFWHNHPSGDSISSGDWLVAGAGETIEVLAVTARGSMFVGRIPTWVDGLDVLLDRMPSMVGYANIPLLPRDGDPDELLRVSLTGLVGHLFNVELARRGLVLYGFSLSPEDAGILEQGATKGYVALAERKIAENLDRLMGALRSGTVT